VSIQADDEFNLKLALESELDDVTPRAGLADLVIARHRKGRRRRFAGVFGLFVVFAGIGVPIGVAGTSGGTPTRTFPAARPRSPSAAAGPGSRPTATPGTGPLSWSSRGTRSAGRSGTS
jgi:hypothetical protein